MAIIAGGATVDGKKPLPAIDMHQYGVKGSAKPSTPKASQIAGEGATETGASGQHMLNSTESKPDLNSPKAAAERISTGTTAEEQKKRLAAKMYPSSRGLREYGAGGTL